MFRLLFDGPPNFLKDPNVVPRMKQHKGKESRYVL
jgi:hypothetical protein